MSAPTDVTTPGSALELLIPWPSPGQALVRSPTGDIDIDQNNAHLVTAPWHRADLIVMTRIRGW